MEERLNAFIEETISSFEQIETERKAKVNSIAEYIADQRSSGKIQSLIFICTHNSRRSHLGQVWADVASWYYDLPILSFSGGTETTAFNINAIRALENCGLEAIVPEGVNPKVRLRYTDDEPEIVCFSKVFDDPANPNKDFIALMTCDDANENCPFVPGADRKFALTYKDPKAFDGTEQQEQAYHDRCSQIAREVFYLFHQIKINNE